MQEKRQRTGGSPALPTGPKAIRGSSRRRRGSIESAANEMLKPTDKEIAALAIAQAEAAARRDQVGSPMPSVHPHHALMSDGKTLRRRKDYLLNTKRMHSSNIYTWEYTFAGV